MKTLDCETADSTCVSLEEILRVERSLLEDILGNFGLEGARPRDPGRTDGEILLHAVLKQARTEGPDFDRTCWFHFTRCHPRNSFSRGLLPLRDALPFLWGFLLMLLPEDFPLGAWHGFAKDPPSELYHRRLNDTGSYGPFACLLGEAGTRAEEFGLRELPAGPSIVQDICRAFQEEYGFDLLHAYRENTRPCVVKFVDHRTGPGQIGAALQYLYSRLHAEPLPLDRQFHFDAEGRAIPPHRILKVEFLRSAEEQNGIL